MDLGHSEQTGLLKNKRPRCTKRNRWLFAVVAFVLVVVASTAVLTAIATDGADSGEHVNEVQLLFNVTLHTMDEDLPRVSAMAWQDGRILGLGSLQGLELQFPEARQVNGLGHVVLPGLIDGHGHLVNMGLEQMRAQLFGLRSLDAVLGALVAFAEEQQLPDGEWLLGRGWDQSLWDDPTFPTRYDLDTFFPNNPVFLGRVDGHMAWANSYAIDLADLPEGDPPGGEIIRDEDGVPTGLFLETAMALIPVPETSDEDIRIALTLAVRTCHRFGITGVHDAGNSKRYVDAAMELVRLNSFDLRAYMMLESSDSTTADHFCPLEGPVPEQIIGFGDDRLTVRAVKLMVDGALGSRGAKLLEPYSDDPETDGVFVLEPEVMLKKFQRWARCEYQLCTHAIGDAANRAVLDGYQTVLNETQLRDHRWRVEHAQILTAQDWIRFRELSVWPSVQPTHATSDMRFALDRLGPDRLATSYLWQSFIELGSPVCFGSDFPVEPVDPFLGLYAAVTRQDSERLPEGGWYPNERVSVYNAIKGFTLWAAEAGFQEDQLGSLQLGKRADFILIDRDPMRVISGGTIGSDQDPMNLLETVVQATVFNGKCVFGHADNVVDLRC